MKEFGLEYAPGVGKRANKPDGQRTPAEQQFAAATSQYKERFVERRSEELRALMRADVRALTNEEKKLRETMTEQVAAYARTCVGEIQRGKRDRDGNLKTMPSDEQLEARVITNVARQEATQELFAYDFVPVYTWSATHGLVQHI
jgi:hypothetical protein